MQIFGSVSYTHLDVYKRQIQNGMFSYASAVSMFKSVIAFLLVLTVNTISKKLEGSHLF